MPTLDDNTLAFALREGGHTQRCHTIPHHGDASVAKHSWNMAALLYVLWPDCPQKLLWAVLMHDVPERWVGDTPAPAKYTINPNLGTELKAAEAKIERVLGIGFQLDERDRRWLKALDILELLMYCDDQLAMGNQNVQLTRQNCIAILDEDWVPGEVDAFMYNYSWKRTREVVDGEIMNGLKEEQITDAKG